MDRVEKFAAWWMKDRPLKPPADDVFVRVGTNTGTVLYRDGEFQVQLFICDPDSEVTEHGHPNVETIAVYVSGDLWFSKNGEQLLAPGMIPPTGLSHRVRPTDTHGATIGPRGAVFITIQEWLNGELPKSVHRDWAGAPLDEKHAAELPWMMSH